MLSEIHVKDFAIINKIEIPFHPGLNIISGETGAGKSILIKSLGLLMGGKSTQTDIRQGAEKAVLEGCFDISQRKDIQEKLNDLGIEFEDHQLIVRRVMQKSGKSRVYLNGHICTLNDLRQIVFPLVTLSNPVDAPLIEITGQHENKNLTSSFYQMDLLDQFSQAIDLREQCRRAYERLSSLQDELNELESRSMEREQRMDFLRFQIQEIEELDLIEGEDEKILEKIRFLRQQGKWQEWFTQADQATGESLSLLKKIQQGAPDNNHPQLKDFFAELDQAYNLVEDCSFQLNQVQQSMDSSEDSKLDDLESRLNRIRKLQKKFGEDLNEVVEKHNHMKQELADLENFSNRKNDLLRDIKKVELELKGHCHKLSEKRKKAAKTLSQKVNKELKDLNMKGLTFVLAISPLEKLGPNGADSIEFKVQNGTADEPRPLAKTASGGELSRILLSLKQVIGASKSPRTFLFDEIDTGVSGETAEKVGAKLKNLAKGQQVLCVTHLPQVACFGDHHFYIEKKPSKTRIQMAVSELDKDERIKEIARLISGEKITKTSLAHAKQLLSL